VHEAETYRERSVRNWDAVASAWDRHRDVTRRACRELDAWMLGRLAPEPGQTLLDLAAGPGDIGLELAQRMGGEGRVLLVDQSRAMLESARSRAQALGLEEVVDVAVMDAGDLKLADASVDGALCRFGYMLMADPGAALVETRRVLAPDGRLVFAVWAEASSNPWALVLGPVMTDRGWIAPSPPGEPGMFVLSDLAALRDIVTGAGFDDVEIARVPVHWPYGDFDEYWETATAMSPAMSKALLAAPPDQVAEVRAVAADRFEAARDDDGTLPGMTVAVAAR